MKQTPGKPTDNARGSLLARLKARVLPETPDFYRLLIEQCRVTVAGTSALARFLQTDDAAEGIKVRRLEHEGDRVKAANLETLHRSFATPMDREDFYDAVVAIDDILNYAKSSVREVDILALSPDSAMAEMAEYIDGGARELLLGFERLKHDPAGADDHAAHARKAERRVEKVYRRALAGLFDPALQLKRLRSLDAEGASNESSGGQSAGILLVVTQMLKRREIYRHLSNAADQLAHAAQILENIVSKAS